MSPDARGSGERPLPARISAEALDRQADVAEREGNPQLAENLRRGAELSALDADRILEIYEALRPGRSSVEQLETIAERLRADGAERCAALVVHAAESRRARGEP